MSKSIKYYLSIDDKKLKPAPAARPRYQQGGKKATDAYRKPKK